MRRADIATTRRGMFKMDMHDGQRMGMLDEHKKDGNTGYGQEKDGNDGYDNEEAFPM